MKMKIKYSTLKRKNKIYLKIPEKMMMLNSEWKIKLVKTLTHHKKKVDGLCVHRTKTIKLLETNTNIKRTLFHELTHAINNEMGWANTESIALIHGWFMEMIYDQISPNGEARSKEQGLTDYVFQKEFKAMEKDVKSLVHNEIKKAKKRTKKVQKSKR